MTKADQVKKALRQMVRPGKKEILARFFKTGPGQYGAGDKFIGVMAPDQRIVAKRFKDLSLADMNELLASPVHEHRSTGLLILTGQFNAADWRQKRVLLKYYLSQAGAVNNWDLVDLTAEKIVGRFVAMTEEFRLLDSLAESKNMWQRRIAMVATLALIKERKLEQTWRLAKKFLTEEHDLMHKAVGWMLREAGKRDEQRLVEFIERHIQSMPRTTLRYAIEKFDESQRQRFLKNVTRNT